jgi:L-threonylcarbamoyladenylate synthase
MNIMKSAQSSITHSKKETKRYVGDDTILVAGEQIRAGDVVAFPTETVYGLGADATSSEACKKIYLLKGRPSNNPLIVHIAEREDAYKYGEINSLAQKIMNNFWPGPLSIVVKAKKDSGICSVATAGLETIALRMPDHKVALALIKESNKPIAAPSANISNYVSPTEVIHVQESFGGQITILEGEKSVFGLESTIVDVSSEIPVILRYGFITPETLSKILECEIGVMTRGKIVAPGMMQKHYAPKTPLRLNATKIVAGEIGLGFGAHDIGELNLSHQGNLSEAASNFYSMLRLLDAKASRQKLSGIAIAQIPDEGIGLAINDRLKRGAES